MFKRILLGIAALWTVAQSHPAGALTTVQSLGCFSMATLTGTTSLPTVPAGATAIEITISGASVNYRDDGTSPTATATGGINLPIGTSFYAGTLSKFQIIQNAATATAFYCTYK